MLFISRFMIFWSVNNNVNIPFCFYFSKVDGSVICTV